MGVLIELESVRRRSPDGARRPARPPTGAAAEFYFDLADPWSYLAAERVDRCFTDLRWTPASAAVLAARPHPPAAERDRREAEARAEVLRLPLQWPERFPEEVPAAMRAAHHACQQGRGGAFVLAAGRLAFCGGFDLEDGEVLAEAAAAAGIGLDETLTAARDVNRDAAIDFAGRRLVAAGAAALPVLKAGRRFVCGEAPISALAAARARLAAV